MLLIRSHCAHGQQHYHFMPEKSLSNTCIFFFLEDTAFLYLGILDSATLCLRVLLNSKITNKKHKHAKDVALDRKEDTFYSI